MRSFFASPPQSAAKARRGRSETARKEAEEEQTRRRTFAFLKHSDRRTPTSMNKSREHAKQLAMAFSSEEPELQSPVSTSSAGFTPDFAAFQQTVSVTKQATSSSMLDDHLAQDREPTSSTVASLQDSFETGSVGSAYDMDFLGNSKSAFPTSTPSRNKKNRPKSTNTLDQFVERHQAPHFQDPNAQRKGGSLDMRQKSANNSQASWPGQEQERSVISMPTLPSNSSMQSNYTKQNSSGSEAQSSSSGAAARRRMRNHIRQSSNSSVASGNEDADSYCSTPPGSPPSAKRISSAAKNRLTAYQSSGPKNISGSSFHSQSSANSQHSSDNLFDFENDGGFTFDAFGLDQSQVEREVNEAMQELAGQGMPGFSMFLDPNNDEFAPQNWDNSPAGSRQSTPTPSEEGFVDGFRVTRQASERESPPSSASSQNNDGRVNLFKEQAGFGSSTPQKRYARSSAANSHTPPKQNHTPPRWENASPNRGIRKTVPAAPTALMDEPINPWTQDPWSSDPENNSQSDVGTNSDFGGTKSDIVTSAHYKSNARWTQSSAKSDIGVSNNKSVSFSSNLVASQHPEGDSSDDGAEAQMQGELAQEFAEDFVSMLSPRHEQAQHESPNQYDNSHEQPEYGPQGDGHFDQYQQQDYARANQYKQQDFGRTNQYEQQDYARANHYEQQDYGRSNQLEQQRRAHSNKNEQQTHKQSHGAHSGESAAQSDVSVGYGHTQSLYSARAEVGGDFGQYGPEYGQQQHTMDQGAPPEQSHYDVHQVDEYGHPQYGPDQVADIGHEQYALGQDANYGHVEYGPGQEADYARPQYARPQYGPGQEGDYGHAQYGPGQGVVYGQSPYSDHGSEYSQSPYGAQFAHGEVSGYGQQAQSPDGAQSEHDDAFDFGDIKSPYADHFEYAQRSSGYGDHQIDHGETADYEQAQSGYGPSHPTQATEPDNTPSGYHMRVAQGSTSPAKSTGVAQQKASSDNVGSKSSFRPAYGAATAGYRGSKYDASSKDSSAASSDAGVSSHYGEAPDNRPGSIKKGSVAAKRGQFNSVTMTAAEKYAQQTSSFLPKPSGVTAKKWGNPASSNVPEQDAVPASKWKKQTSMDAAKSPAIASTSFLYPQSAGGADSNAGAHSDYGPLSDVGVHSEVGTHSDYGPRSDVGVNSDVQFGSELGGEIPTEVSPKSRKSDQKSPGAVNGGGRFEEKKDDDCPLEVKKVLSHKAKWKHWESKSTSFEKKTPASQPKQKEQSQATKDNISTLQTSLGDEFLTPAIIEARRQEARRLRQEELKRSSIDCGAVPSSPTKLSQGNLRKAGPFAVSFTQEQRLNDCNDQRTPFASFRERLRPAQHAKSEGGAAVRTSAVNQVLDRLQKNSPRGAPTADVNIPSTYPDTQSDVGASPSFLAGVQLLKTPSSKFLLAGDEVKNMESGNDYLSPREESGRPLSYRERAYDQRAEDNEDPPQENEPEEIQGHKPPLEKKLTYRERRELELKREEAEKAKQEASKVKKKEPERDVASLIRRRIAANKQKDEEAVSSEKNTDFSEPVSQYRTLLKPVKSEGSAQKESLSNQRPSYNTESRDQPYPASSDYISPQKGSLTFRSTQDQERNFDSHPASSSPRHFDQNRPSRLDNVQEQSTHGELSGDTAVYDMVSPSSAMEYSTDTSHRNGDALRSPRESTQHYRSPRETTQDYRTASGANHDYRSPRESSQDGNANKQPNTKLQIDSNHFERFMEDKKSGSAETSSIRSQETPATADTSQTGGSKDAGDEEPTGSAGVKAMLSSFLVGKGLAMSALPAPSNDDDAGALMRNKRRLEVRDNPPVETITTSPSREAQEDAHTVTLGPPTSSGRPALKDDPKFERYFRMLKVGMPIDVVKHAMKKDGADPTVMDGDHNKPVGLPLKEDPRYTKYFKMLKMGISIEQVKHAMERDGLAPEIMDQDHSLPADLNSSEKTEEPKEKATHRRARLHWNTLQKVRSNSLWAKIEKDPEILQIHIDEEEFNELFQADLTPAISPRGLGANRKRGAAVRVIDAKRANNGGIILARLKMTHDEMADAVDRIDGDALNAEQIEHIIEFLPTKEERNQLEKYMLTGGQDAAEKFDGLCECEKFMVSMMTVKHAKRKVRALLFQLQFMSCLESIAEDTTAVETSCNELSNSTRLRQLLGIVLQFGNRLNTAGVHSKRKAGAFTLDSLLKLNQAKAFDKKTTFLHYVVLIVQRNNELLLRFKDDLPTVLKADKVYWDQCLADLEEVENQLENVRRIALHQARIAQQCRLKKSKTHDDDDNDSLGGVSLSLEEEVESLRATRIGLFTLGAIKQVSALRDKVEVTKSKFHRLLEYFGEEDKKWQPHDLFNVITTFCRDFEKAKEEVDSSNKKKQREERKKARTHNPNSGKPPAGPDRTPMPLRASSLQPNMSKVLKDVHKSSPNPSNSREPTTKVHNGAVSRKSNNLMVGEHQRSELSKNGPSSATSQSIPTEAKIAQSISPRTNAQLDRAIPEVPPPQGMQESGRFEAVLGSPKAVSSPKASNSSAYAAPMHQPAATVSAKEAMRHKARTRRHRQMQVVSGRATPITSNSADTRSPESASAVSPEAPPRASSPQGNSSAKITPRVMIRHRRRMEAKTQVSPPSQLTNYGADWPTSSELAGAKM